MKKHLLLKSALALALATPLLASAESQLIVGGGTAAARLDFRVVIPRVLLLQVGNAGTGAANINLVEFNLGVIEPGIGGAGVARTNGGAIPVRVLGNSGPITLAVANNGNLTTGTVGEAIPWTDITVASAIVTGAAIPHPSAAFSGNTVLATTAGRVTNSSANWTFNYANTSVLPAGTYGGVDTNNSRVTYTATML